MTLVVPVPVFPCRAQSQGLQSKGTITGTPETAVRPWEGAHDMISPGQSKLTAGNNHTLSLLVAISLCKKQHHRDAMNGPSVSTTANYFGNYSQLKEAKALDLLKKHMPHLPREVRETLGIKTSRVTITEIGTYRAGCSYIYFCFYFLASDPLSGYRSLHSCCCSVWRETKVNIIMNQKLPKKSLTEQFCFRGFIPGNV